MSYFKPFLVVNLSNKLKTPRVTHNCIHFIYSRTIVDTPVTIITTIYTNLNCKIIYLIRIFSR